MFETCSNLDIQEILYIMNRINIRLQAFTQSLTYLKYYYNVLFHVAYSNYPHSTMFRKNRPVLRETCVPLRRMTLRHSSSQALLFDPPGNTR